MSNEKLIQAVKEYAEKNSMVYIPVKEYDKLLEDQRFLQALLGAGVDNWAGYDYAIDMLGTELI